MGRGLWSSCTDSESPHGASGKVRAEWGGHLGGCSGFLLFHCKAQRAICANGKLLLEQMLVNFAGLLGHSGVT